MSYADVRHFYEDFEDPEECPGCGVMGYDCKPCSEYRDLRLSIDEALEGGLPEVPVSAFERLRLLEGYRRSETVECPHGHGAIVPLYGCDTCEDLRIEEAIAASILDEDPF
ncbi:MAG TPA: hypothetical protein VLT87_11230 [Thermoanaerobaculia bacterium]|nr:hypothetical protein [Thermoanaerobaculia bacterium]